MIILSLRLTTAIVSNLYKKLQQIIENEKCKIEIEAKIKEYRKIKSEEYHQGILQFKSMHPTSLIGTVSELSQQYDQMEKQEK